jgi:hypothetical protein
MIKKFLNKKLNAVDLLFIALSYTLLLMIVLMLAYIASL